MTLWQLRWSLAVLRELDLVQDLELRPHQQCDHGRWSPMGEGGVWMGFTLDYMDHFDGREFTHYDSTGMRLLGQRIRTFEEARAGQFVDRLWGRPCGHRVE
ncbi:MAG: hypothetical protein IPL64_08445 [Flavobacteriales bacterium]|nr:hypothetical protein [Flavobacteriales bacterium]